MKIKNLLFLAACTATLVACNDDENGTATSGDILFSTTVTNQDGSSGSGYLQVIQNLESGAHYDNTNAIPLGFGSYPCVCESGNIYVFPDYMGGTELKLKRFTLNANKELELQGSMTLPANSSAAIVVEASNEKAYVCCQSLDLIIVFNPTTMTEISRIDLSSLRNEGLSAYPGAMYIRDGILYVALEQYNAQWMPNENAAELQIASIIYLIPFVVQANMWTLTQVFPVLNKVKKPAIAMVILGIWNVILCLTVSRTSFVGYLVVPIIASVLNVVYCVVYVPLCVGKFLSCSVKGFYLHIFKAAMASAVVIVITIFMKNIIICSNWFRFIICGGVCAISAYLVFFMLIIDKDNKRRFISLVMGKLHL